MDSFALPANLVAAARGDRHDRRRDWLATLPGLVADLAARWSLRVGEPFQPGGQTAWVAPATDDRGNDLVLKVGWWNTESVHEADALRVWEGHGAVRLHAAHELGETLVLLMERCLPGTVLSDVVAEEEQDEIVAGLLRRLWVQPEPGSAFRSLQVMCDEWADEFEEKHAETPAPLDGGLIRDGLTLFRSLPTSADTAVLLCTDLHAANILAAQREPWLVVDPTPYVGDPAYDVLQHMLNCPDRLLPDPLALVRRLADLLDLDHERLRLWLFARCVQESIDWPGLDTVARRIAPR